LLLPAFFLLGEVSGQTRDTPAATGNLNRHLSEQEKRIATQQEKINALKERLDAGPDATKPTPDRQIADQTEATPGSPGTTTPYTAHVVAVGENLASIAARHGLSDKDLARFNEIEDPNKIFVGQVLKIPATENGRPIPSDLAGEIAPPAPPSAPPAAEPSTPEAPATHRVEAGETYTSIARKWGFSVNQLEEANPGVDPTRLLVGQTIKLPGAASAPDPASPPTPVNTVEHIVRDGENLTTIARNFNTTNEVILSLNSITDPESIHTGQKLQVPDFDDQTIDQARQETLEQERQQAAREAAIAEAASAQPDSDDGTRKTHTITPGQSLFIIAQYYDVTIDQLKEWNALTSDTIFAGQDLYVAPPAPTRQAPAEDNPDDPEDPEEEAANEENPTPQALYNSPAGPRLPPAIAIPRNEFAAYSVRDGDTLQSIARRYFLSVHEISDINRLPRDAELQPGQLLVLPMHALYSYTASQEPTASPPANDPETAGTHHR